LRVTVGSGRITIVGLGPAGASLLLPAGRDALTAASKRFVRTARHPAVAELAAQGIAFESFDAHYEREPALDRVYAGIVAALFAAVEEHGDVVYAVPGSPNVAERTVTLLHEAVTGDDAAHRDVELRVVPGLSFADLALCRLGIDPLAAPLRVVDGRSFAVDSAGASGRMLIAQCDSTLVLSEVKLALLDLLDGDERVTVLQRLGTFDERVDTVALCDLDRAVVPDHLTSVYADTGTREISGELAALWQLTLRLRGPGGCPWDAEQTHHSLARHTLEEAYEVVEAIEVLPPDAPRDTEPAEYAALEDELGDLLFQVMIHSALASEAGAFTVADVAATVHEKLVRRHPHVFGTVDVAGADDVVRNWEQIKQVEKGTESLVDGLPAALPALLYTPKLYRKLAVADLDPSDDTPTKWLHDAVARLDAATPATLGAAIGEALGAVVAVARAAGIDAESALRGFASRLRDDFRSLETGLHGDGVEVKGAGARSDVRAEWERIRIRER
jgi:tetrapyrrole methylase family protein/MazG family protein